MRLVNVLVLGVMLCGLMSAVGADELEDARALINSEQYELAYQTLQPMVEDRIGDPDFDLLLGISALETGRTTEASFALERVLDAEPDNPRARAELARAYYEMGDHAAARDEFAALEDAELPPEVDRTISKYLSVIQTEIDTGRTLYSIFVQGGVGYDSNVNSATTDRTVLVPSLPGLPFTLGSGALEQSSGIYQLTAGFQFSSPLSDQLAVLGGVFVEHRIPGNETDFRFATHDGYVGLNLARDEQNQYRIFLQGQQFNVGGEINRRLGALNAEWAHVFDARNQLSLFAQFALQRFPEQEVRDVNTLSLGFAWAHALTQRSALFLTGYGGFDDEQVGRRDDIGRDFAGVRLGTQFNASRRTALYGSILYQYSRYGDDDPFFQQRREDHYYVASAGLRYALDDNWSVRPEISYSRNDSKLAVNDYDRVEVMIYIRNDF